MTREYTQRISLFLAWLIALIAMLGTLYASEIAKLPVCHLCWYQRISIYPLAIILGIASYRDDFKIALYGIPLAIIGAGFAIYQYLEQMMPGFGPINFCGTGPDCSEIHIQLFGFMTFPFFSFLACLAIVVLLILAYKKT